MTEEVIFGGLGILILFVGVHVYKLMELWFREYDYESR